MQKLVLLAAVTLSSLAFAYDPHNTGECSGPYYCKNEQVEDHRAPRPVYQPQVTTPVPGACGDTLPLNESYNAHVNHLSCGFADQYRERGPEPVSDEILDHWDVQRRSPLLRDKAQQTRKLDIKVEGAESIGVSYSWTYEYITGNYDLRCGTEIVDTQCTVQQFEDIPSQVDDTDKCLVYEQIKDEEPPPPPPPGSDYDGNGPTPSHSSTPATTNPRHSTPDGDLYKRHDVPDAKRYKGTDSDSINQKRQQNYRGSGGGSGNPSSTGNGKKKKMDYDLKKKPSLLKNLAYNPREDRPVIRTIASATGYHNGKCTQYAKKTIYVPTILKTFSYECSKPLNRWCTWPVTQQKSKACGTQSVNFVVRYLHDDNWKPGFRGSLPYRDYMDELPNKADLLVGEREKLHIVANKAEGGWLTPELQVETKWNEYQVKPVQSVECKFQSTPTLEYSVWTVGRNKAKSPNPLVARIGDDGKPMNPPLEFPNGQNGNLGAGKPGKILLTDNSREDYIVASEQSRNFARQDDDTGKDKNGKANVNQYSKFWAVTDYRVQLLRKSHGYWVAMTPVDKFNSNVGDIVGDSITISLNGGNGIPKFYYPQTGVVPDFLGRFLGNYGVELQPGEDYYLKIWAIQKSLPFYISGCKKGENVCDEIAGEKAFSEALIIQWKADPKFDDRSWYAKFRNFRERFKVY